MFVSFKGTEAEVLKRLEINHRRSLPDAMRESFRVTETDRGGYSLFKIEPKNGSDGRAVLFIHGGGGIMRPTPFHYKMAANLVNGTGAALYLPLYPLAPEHNAKESYECVREVYADILGGYAPECTAVVGDSAGAVMASALISLAERKPSCAVLISPAVGVDRSDPEFEKARRRDIILSYNMLDFIGKYWSAGIDPKSVYTDAMSADYAGFPPVLLFYGTNEMFYPGMAAYTEKIRGGGAELTVREGRGMFHDWAISDAYPEGKKAIGEICGFILKKTSKTGQNQS